ncbi:site-specific recombinase XerD [Desulfosporosinus acidiphilus SJ4]|uniref:Site-specific recombinase XerD n=1 Tax=Desulfosporosinus acidiphilus (strain DSM 22704 / JCM 16185 / SJ4) TaxID=646529 RepID=I4D578_DESAJ|nr:site-specific integrase [Desulfosporosinus acidiphilus]AFM40952.1 site-specific recombinase XerD [Desulfosporosinus acidiphilus SJ4]
MAQLRNRGTNVWQIQIYLKKDGEGKKQFHYETFYGSKPQAKLHANKLELDFKTKVGSSKTTIQSVEDLLITWLHDIQKQIEKSTYDQYKRHAEKLKDLLGDLQLYTVNSVIIAERLKELDGSGLSARTIKNHYRTLMTALNWGAGKKYLSRDVMVGIKPPMIQHVSRNVLKSDELKLFIQTAKLYKHYLPLKILAITGMRIGELMGLKWKNLSHDGKIKIVEAVNSKSRYLKATKTKNSKRELQLDSETTEELREYKKAMSQNNKANDNDFVFQSDNGDFLPYEALYKTKQEVLKKAGLHHIRIHDLRHGVGSLMLDSGASITTVAEQLGQVPATTAGIYSHSLRKGGTITSLL